MRARCGPASHVSFSRDLACGMCTTYAPGRAWKRKPAKRRVRAKDRFVLGLGLGCGLVDRTLTVTSELFGVQRRRRQVGQHLVRVRVGVRVNKAKTGA
eukprot:scaffold9967_cov64-Phaeocystis_antarctica.AAC.5